MYLRYIQDISRFINNNVENDFLELTDPKINKNLWPGFGIYRDKIA
jgi:hypothetical protein